MKKVATVDVYEIPGHGLVLADLGDVPDVPWRWLILPTTSGGWVVGKFVDAADIARWDKVGPMHRTAAKIARAVEVKTARRGQ